MQTLMYRREYSVCGGNDGFVLDVRDRWLPGLAAEHLVTGVLAALGHPCCGRGLGRIEKVRELSCLLLVAPNQLFHRDRHLVHLSLTTEEAFALEPTFVKVLSDVD